jgi:L,D-peptidoglycan transpeptidase YkuD (ErfK/YbiS/YcfS/YnhG family)
MQGVLMRARVWICPLLAVPLVLSSSPAQAAQPRVLSHVGSTTKVVIVTTSSWQATSGTMTLWQKVNGSWRRVRGSMPARVGRSGFKTDRREGDGSSPAGTFPMRFAFGSRANPGVHIGWKALVPRSCWSGERRDYNRWVHRTCTRRDENLWASRAVAYRYAAVIGYNDSPPAWGKGSGIFVHETTGRATAGCVAVREADLVATLRWMTPGTKIVMGPQSYVARL